MRNQLISGAIMMLSGAFLAIRLGVAYAMFDQWPLVTAALAYAAAAIWWIASLIRERRPTWRHAAAAWVPVLLPAAATVNAAVGVSSDDTSALAFVTLLPVTAAMFFACGAGCLLVLERRAQLRRRTG